VSYQQDQVDEAEKHIEKANQNAGAGLKQIEKAYAKASESNCNVS
jgi:t-SNARE complex subunit (syntaxin)